MSRKNKTESDSPAYQLIALVWKYEQTQSIERWYAAMRDAVQLAIEYGLRFELDDFCRLWTAERWSPQYGAGEDDYALACGRERGRRNPSACRAYEKYKQRRPLMIAGKGLASATRIYVGRKFWWQDELVTCTSFADDGQSLIACTYQRCAPKQHRRKVARRIRITREDLAAERKRVREEL